MKTRTTSPIAYVQNKSSCRMKPGGLFLLMIIVLLLLSSDFPTLRIVGETFNSSVHLAFSSLNNNAFAAETVHNGPNEPGLDDGIIGYGNLSGINGVNELNALKGLRGHSEFSAHSKTAENQIAVPLSSPGQPGRLILNMVRGSVQVTGYDGEEVVIRYEGTTTRSQEGQEAPEGMRRITGRSPGFETIENNNVVEMRNISPWENMKFEIFVPENFSMKLSLVHGDTLHVNNVSGDLEISHVSGNVSLVDVGGAAVINTVNGDIVCSFRQTDSDKPMAFSTLNGVIDITIPADARFTARMKSEFGDVFTDFDMKLRDESAPRINSSMPFKISVNEWVVGDVNDGGPEYRFSNLRGNIYIRQR